MRLFVQKIFLLAIVIIAFSACVKKKDSTAPAGNGEVKVEFFNYVGGTTLSMDSVWYTNQHGDSFTVSKFNYYISNIKLNGSSVTYTETNSYHLVQQSDLTTTSFDMASVPYGQYSSITLTIGVDSLHNVSGAQTGALDPLNGMFWSWNTGYIMLKFEGNSPKSPQADGALLFHTGGFSGEDNVLKTITLTFPSPIQVTKDGENHIHLSADVLALFKSPNEIDFSNPNTCAIQTPGPYAKMIADNYANMFTITYAGL